MITVHHLNNSRSHRVLWLLEELALPYEVVRYQRDEKTMLAPASLRAVHPLGKSPVITEAGRTVAESGAIIEYLAEKYGADRLIPAPSSDEHARYRYFLHYAEGSLMPLLVMQLVFGHIRKAPMPFFAKPIARQIAGGLERSFLAPQLKLHLGFLEGELAKHTWLAGESFSAADVQMSFPLEAASGRAGLSATTYPHVFALLERMRARPAYQRALQKGGALTLDA
jgi:glutathione S-transferase